MLIFQLNSSSSSTANKVKALRPEYTSHTSPVASLYSLLRIGRTTNQTHSPLSLSLSLSLLSFSLSPFPSTHTHMSSSSATGSKFTSLSELVYMAYDKNNKLSQTCATAPDLFKIVLQQRLWKSLQVTFAHSDDTDALAKKPVLPYEWRKPQSSTDTAATASSSSSAKAATTTATKKERSISDSSDNSDDGSDDSDANTAESTSTTPMDVSSDTVISTTTRTTAPKSYSKMVQHGSSKALPRKQLKQLQHLDIHDDESNRAFLHQQNQEHRRALQSH